MQRSLLLLIIGLLVGIGGTMIFTTYFSTNSPLLANELFEKKKECTGLTNEMESFAKYFYGENTQIRKIFYSQKLNSCLFIAYAVRSIGESTTYVIDIMDFFSKESIFGFDTTNQYFNYQNIADGRCDGIQEKCDMFNQKLKELKGE